MSADICFFSQNKRIGFRFLNFEKVRQENRLFELIFHSQYLRFWAVLNIPIFRAKITTNFSRSFLRKIDLLSSLSPLRAQDLFGVLANGKCATCLFLLIFRKIKLKIFRRYIFQAKIRRGIYFSRSRSSKITRNIISKV